MRALGTPPLKHVWVQCVSHRGVSARTSRFLAELEDQGALRDEREGSSDLPLARNKGITEVLLRAPSADRSVLLLVDDDISASVESVVRLCAWPRADAPDHPFRSGVYVNKGVELAATPYENNLHLTGLGLFAARIPDLRAVAQQLRTVRIPNNKVVFPFCTSGPIGGQWYPDDYSMTARLGGVWLDPDCPARHEKLAVLVPTDATLLALREQRYLFHDPEATEVTTAPMHGEPDLEQA